MALDRIAILSSWSRALDRGTGVAMALDNLARAIEAHGVLVEWPLHAIDRGAKMGIDRTRKQLEANRQPLPHPLPAVTLAVDFDGHRIPGRRLGGESLKIVNVRTNFIELEKLCPDYDRANMSLRAEALRENIRTADAIATSSRHTFNYLTRDLDGLPEHHVMMPNAIDEKLRAALSTGVSPRDRTPMVLGYGKGLWRKDYSTAIRASVELARRGLEHTFELLTYGSLLDEFRRLVQANNAKHIVIRRTTGDRTELSELLRRAWVVCHPAIQEDFGNVFLEAAAAGTPVVTTRTSMTEEHGLEPAAGILVPPGDVGAFADALESIATHAQPTGPSHEPLPTTYSSGTWRDSTRRLLEFAQELSTDK